MQIEDFAGMLLKEKKIIEDAGLEIECYLNPKNNCFYQLNRKLMLYRIGDPQKKFGEWKNINKASLFDKMKMASTLLAERAVESAGDSLEVVADGCRASIRQMESVSKKMADKLDDTKVPEFLSKTSAAVSDGFDTVTGEKILKLVEERLAIQAKYNDILATKLDEALRRIEALEEKILGKVVS